MFISEVHQGRRVAGNDINNVATNSDDFKIICRRIMRDKSLPKFLPFPIRSMSAHANTLVENVLDVAPGIIASNYLSPSGDPSVADDDLSRCHRITTCESPIGGEVLHSSRCAIVRRQRRFGY